MKLVMVRAEKSSSRAGASGAGSSELTFTDLVSKQVLKHLGA